MTEKRQAVRAAISLYARAYRVTSEDRESEQLTGMQDDGIPDFYSDQEGERMDLETYLDPLLLTFSDFLIQIDEKLQRILNHLEKTDAPSGMLTVLETVDLSGTGVCLQLAERVEPDVLLRIELRIPGFPRGVFRTCGRVVRVVERSLPRGPVHEVGIRFLNVTEVEQDRLVAFTFSQQRQMLRERKARRTHTG